MMATSPLVAVAGVFAVTLTISLVVLMKAELAVGSVARTAVKDISASFWAGLLWQLLAAPILLALALACALTLVGLFLIPLVVLAWALAYAGAFTLGLTAVAMVVGRALAGRGPSSAPRAVALRSLIVGMVVLFGIWFVAALLSDVAVLRSISRLLAVGLTWAVLTVGLGAVAKSRGGMLTFRLGTTAEQSTPSWQTPTPVSGIVAAKRLPVSVYSLREGTVGGVSGEVSADAGIDAGMGRDPNVDERR